jgi:TRAP-type mannitol/chloroaromatic compound transport system permease large subunit
MAWFAFAMLGLALALMATTGWASYAVLLLVASVIAAVGVVSGGIDASTLQTLPSRLVGLLEHDLLQAVALYAFVGALLRHTEVAKDVLLGFERGLRRAGVSPAACPALAGYGVGVLAAPMNGSVGAGIGMLAQTVAPRWRNSGLPPTTVTTLTAVTATLGVLVPPSLVLLLLGDAMMRAHTEGLLLARATGVRVINTQDLIQACAPVAAVLALSWAATTAWCARVRPVGPELPPPPRHKLAAVLVPLAVLALLTGVATGWLRAIEAAAAAGLLLLAFVIASGQLPRHRVTMVLDDALSLTGALFALLVAANTLSLVLRAAGCDRLVADGLALLGSHPSLALLAVMAGLLLMAFVLDAFELVFLVVPIVMPPLLAQVPDAAWVACLTLLVLQVGFLLPPWGYSVVMARSMAGSHKPLPLAMARELLPYLGVLAVVFGCVFAYPPITHWLRSESPGQTHDEIGTDAMDDLIRSMGTRRQMDDAPDPK